MGNENINDASNLRIRPIILVDKNKPQFFNFDQGLVVTERTVKKILPVMLHLNNDKGVFSAASSEITATKLMLSLSPKDIIVESDFVWIDFTTLFNKYNHDFFLKVPYQVEAIEKNDIAWSVSLNLAKDANPEFVLWFKQWLKSVGQTNKYEENNDKLFNCMFSYYKRLYSVYLAYPIIFSDSKGIEQAFLSNEAVTGIDFSNGQRPNARLSVNVFDQYISDQKLGTRIPLYVWYEKGSVHYITSADVPKVSPKQIIAWLKTKEQWRVLLIRTRQVKVPAPEQIEAIQKYSKEKFLEEIEAFKDSFAELTAVTSVLDISKVFENIVLDWQNLNIESGNPSLQSKGVSYSTISFRMKRQEARFRHITKIKVAVLNKEYPVEFYAETTDLSFMGLSIKMPVTDFPISNKDQLVITFEDWNAELSGTGLFFKKKTKLPPVPYAVKNVEHDEDFILLGVARNRLDSEASVNQFFKEKLTEIKLDTKGVLRNDLDLYNSFYASAWLTNNIAGLPFFLGQDEQGIRIIQAIANTEENQTMRKPYQVNDDWSFLQQVATSMSVGMRDLLADKSRPLKLLSFGLYCYYEEAYSDTSQRGWITKTDLELNSSELKMEFIREAIGHSKHYFYHCSLVSVKGYKDDVLSSEVVEFMSKAPHRVKEMHSLCNSLIAVGELNEITRLVEFMYN